MITETAREFKIKNQTLYCNVFYNNDTTPIEVVLIILQYAFKLSAMEASNKVMEIHNSEKGIINIDSKEICDAKNEQVLKIMSELGEKNLITTVEVYDAQ